MTAIINGLGAALNAATFGLLEKAAKAPGNDIKDYRVMGFSGASDFSSS